MNSRCDAGVESRVSWRVDGRVVLEQSLRQWSQESCLLARRRRVVLEQSLRQWSQESCLLARRRRVVLKQGVRVPQKLQWSGYPGISRLSGVSPVHCRFYRDHFAVNHFARIEMKMTNHIQSLATGAF